MNYWDRFNQPQEIQDCITAREERQDRLYKICAGKLDYYLDQPTTYVAGMQYGNAKPLRGDVLNLVREPGNQYDPNAIRVELRGELVGYIPAKLTGQIDAERTFGIWDVCRDHHSDRKPDAKYNVLHLCSGPAWATGQEWLQTLYYCIQDSEAGHGYGLRVDDYVCFAKNLI